MSKRLIYPKNFQDVYDFVETYPYWAILDNGTIIFSSENDKDIKDALPEALEIAKKRHKIEVVIRAGSNEHNSRTNDEYIINVQAVNDGEITEVHLQNSQHQTVFLNGQINPQYKNPAGLSAEDIQTYLNGAIDRTKSEMRMYTDNKNLENDVRWSKKMAEQEIQFKRELFQREVEAERERMARERKEFEEMKAKIEEEYEMTNRGLAGVFKSVASIGNEFIKSGSIFSSESKLNGKSEKKENPKPTSNIQDEDTGFEEVQDLHDDEQAEEQGFDVILAGFESLKDEEIEFLQELIEERKAKQKNKINNQENKSMEEQNDESISSNNND